MRGGRSWGSLTRRLRGGGEEEAVMAVGNVRMGSDGAF